MAKPTDKRRFVDSNIERAPDGPGVYRLYESHKLAYVGSARDIHERLERHSDDPRFRNITSFDTLKTSSTREARSLEKRQIDKYDPPKNHR